ncbi:hypothetical protein [Flammeovirga sp. EKP202]|uniref:hypothetical protein n=1 Tax=Flammeovirga sp. EKP202 TaxID=2770592 RepID=UPI00165F70C7|nr:hypothetical protein [Flammeovirga sp. EKP202]MBD0402915.1 hypothetical protein [Flammeovirga sp. EKP202]
MISLGKEKRQGEDFERNIINIKIVGEAYELVKMQESLIKLMQGYNPDVMGDNEKDVFYYAGEILIGLLSTGSQLENGLKNEGGNNEFLS